MRRHFYNLLTSASLALCLFAMLVWFRGRHTYDDFHLSRRSLYVELLSAGGEMHFEIATEVPCPLGPSYESADSAAEDDAFWPVYYGLHPVGANLAIESSKDWQGFGYARGFYDFLKSGEELSGFESPMLGVNSPDWFVVILTAILPALAIWRVIRIRRRAKSFACINCGYDLRATPARCPECGARSSTELPQFKSSGSSF